MTTSPWIALYVADYLADTTHLSTTQHGAYLLLIMRYWQHGGLPDDDEQLARIVGLSLADWRRNRAAIRGFFKRGWKHPRVEQEIADAKAAYERRSRAGRKGGSAGNRSEKGPSNAEALLKQSQPQSHLLRRGSIQGGKSSDIEGLALTQDGGRPRLALVNGLASGTGEDEL